MKLIAFVVVSLKDDQDDENMKAIIESKRHITAQEIAKQLYTTHNN